MSFDFLVGIFISALSTIIGVIVGILIFGLLIYLYFKRHKKEIGNIFQNSSPTKPSISPISPKDKLVKECLDDTKIRPYFYIDEGKVNSLYSQFETITTKEVETSQKEDTNTTDLEVNAHVIGGGKKVEKAKSHKTEVEKIYSQHVCRKCNKLISHLVGNRNANVIDLTMTEYPSTISVKDFDKYCIFITELSGETPKEVSWMREKIKESIESLSIEKINKEIEKTIKDYNKFIVLKAEFDINKNNENHIIFLKKVQENIEILIQIREENVAKDFFEDKQIKNNATVFGLINNWNKSDSKLTIVPIAIY